MSDGKAENTCCIRGVQYHIKLTVMPFEEQSSLLTLTVSTTLLPHRWCGTFDEDTVTSLTSQAGGIKSFTAFIAMLRAAILCLSRSVTLDILSADGFSSLAGEQQSHARNSRPRRKRKQHVLLFESPFDRPCVTLRFCSRLARE